MEPPPVSVILVVVLCLTATLPGPTMVHAEGGSVPGEDTPTTNMTREVQDNQCSPLQRRQDLLDTRVNGLDSSLNARLTERDTDLNTRLNGLNTRQNEVDTRLNRMDSRFDDLETVMLDMKEYLRQRMDAMEVKAELPLAGTTKKAEVASHDTGPTRTSQNKVPKDCQEAYTMGSTSSGVYRITPELNIHIEVFCEQELDGGGWTVFQTRKDGSVDFYRGWNAYKQGFGELTGEFWLGNSYIHELTKHRDQQVKIELLSPDGDVKYADYSHFSVDDEVHKFRLNITGYSGGSPPGDSMAYHQGQKFSTREEDNDRNPKSCALQGHAGWWYKSCNHANLNGLYGSTAHNKGLNWETWKGEGVSMKATRMMIRKKP